MANLLILGGNSNLASCFKNLYPDKVVLTPKNSCDITKVDELEIAIKNFQGNYILNCAAITSAEYCERNVLNCFSVNVTGVYLINKICVKYNKKLIHISSDYAINPPNTYGWTKLLSEKVVDQKFLIVRTNFYNKYSFILDNLLQGKGIQAYNNVFFNPVSINRLAYEVYKNRNKSGIINIFSNLELSYFDFANLASDVFKLENTLISPIAYKASVNNPLSFYSILKSDINIDAKADMQSYRDYFNEYDHR